MNGCGQQHHHIDNFVRGIETEMQYARLEEVTVITLLLHQAWEVRTRDGDAQRRWRVGRIRGEVKKPLGQIGSDWFYWFSFKLVGQI
jgi:hypothetical protein